MAGIESRRAFAQRLVVGSTAVVAGSVAGVVGASPAAAAGLGFNPIDPYRCIDTRAFNLGPFPSGQLLDIDLWTDQAGTPRIPSSASAVTFNLTVTETVGSGFLALFPADSDFPGVSNINWSGPVTIANGGTVALGPSVELGPGCVTVLCGGGGAAQFIIDITGWFG
jgi:hypothetical protein